MSFEGKVVIVTGSSSGIGQAAVLLFAKQEASVTIHGQNPDRVKQTEELLQKEGINKERFHSVLGPIEKEETRQKLIDETIKKFGHLDVLVNSAGAPRHPDFDPDSLESLDFILDTNLKSAIALTRLAVPYLEKTKGNVINISACVGQRISMPGPSPYSLTKAALDHYTRNAALQYAPKGVRVNTVTPGATLTNFGLRHGVTKEALQKVHEHVTDNLIPMGRFGTAEEVANVIEFVASDKASYITGSILTVDGGLLVGPRKIPLATELIKQR